VCKRVLDAQCLACFVGEPGAIDRTAVRYQTLILYTHCCVMHYSGFEEGKDRACFGRCPFLSDDGKDLSLTRAVPKQSFVSDCIWPKLGAPNFDLTDRNRCTGEVNLTLKQSLILMVQSVVEIGQINDSRCQWCPSPIVTNRPLNSFVTLI
jgi:hypothetical protein